MASGGLVMMNGLYRLQMYIVYIIPCSFRTRRHDATPSSVRPVYSARPYSSASRTQRSSLMDRSRTPDDQPLSTSPFSSPNLRTRDRCLKRWEMHTNNKLLCNETPLILCLGLRWACVLYSMLYKWCEKQSQNVKTSWVIGQLLVGYPWDISV